MKKVVSIVLLFCLCIGICACAAKPKVTEPEVTEPEIVFPNVQMVINNSKNNTKKDLRIFPANRSYDQQTAYAHFYVQSENPKETIRIKLEAQSGRNEKTEEDFKVLSDELVDVDTNQWLIFYISITASNLYFYRLTMYYGEHEEVLITKTIYTPYTEPYYNESSFSDTAPKFHPINGLLEKEQAFFNKCRYAVVDYAKTNHYSAVISMIGWQAETRLYLFVEYQGAGGSEVIWFSIKNDDLESYVAHFNSTGVIPKGEGTAEQNVLHDYYYVELALTEAISK